MNKELEEVTIFLQEKIEELNRHIKNYEKSDCKTAIYKQISEEKEVLDKALNYIDNSISKEVIEEKIEEVRKECSERIKNSDTFEGKYTESFVINAQFNSMRCVLQELLEGK